MADLSKENAVVSIYEAKTHLSKLVKRAKAGETILIGAYGNPEAILAPVPLRPRFKLGVGADLLTPELKEQLEHFDDPDPEWDAMWERWLDEPLT